MIAEIKKGEIDITQLVKSYLDTFGQVPDIFGLPAEVVQRMLIDAIKTGEEITEEQIEKER